MEYAFLDQGDERLLEVAQLPAEDGIAVAIRTTGYALEGDEIVELAICDLSGATLFCKRVKPQNIEEWAPSEASGGIAPADVADEPELYQFEDEIAQLLEGASVVVCEHVPFTRSLIESSWVSINAMEGFDLIEEFRHSHCTTDRPREAATAVALGDIERYYGIDATQTASLSSKAASIAACYQALVAEHARQRDAKGEAHWEAYERKLAEQSAAEREHDALAQLREKRYRQMNALLWITGAIIFTGIVIQLQQRGGDAGFMVVAGAAAVFCLVRGIVNFRK